MTIRLTYAAVVKRIGDERYGSAGIVGDGRDMTLVWRIEGPMRKHRKSVEDDVRWLAHRCGWSHRIGVDT